MILSIDCMHSALRKFWWRGEASGPCGEGSFHGKNWCGICFQTFIGSSKGFLSAWHQGQRFLPNRQVATHGGVMLPSLIRKVPYSLEWTTKRAANSEKTNKQKTNKQANKQTNKQKTHFADDFIFVGFRGQTKSPIMSKISGNFLPSL